MTTEYHAKAMELAHEMLRLQHRNSIAAFTLVAEALIERGMPTIGCGMSAERVADQERIAALEADKFRLLTAIFAGGEWDGDAVELAERKVAALREDNGRLRKDSARMDWLIARLNFEDSVDDFVENMVDNLPGESELLAVEFRTAIDSVLAVSTETCGKERG